MPDDKKKPNILIIWGDDIGWFNVSANNHGIMGYRTPNIDRVAKEGCNFTDWYGAAKLHGGPRRVHHRAVADRTGLTKVGPPRRRSWTCSRRTRRSPTS
jgi:arylsulfatase